MSQTGQAFVSFEALLSGEQATAQLAVVGVILGVFLIWAFSYRARKRVEDQRRAELEAGEKAIADTNAVTPSAPAAMAPAPARLNLNGTRDVFWGRISRQLFGQRKVLTTTEMESLEEILYTSDMGPETVQVLMTAVTDEMQAKGSAGLPEVVNTLRLKIHDIFAESGTVDRGPRSLSRAAEGPSVVLVLGVNGAGKTTTIGKLARKLAEEGHKVLVAAGDTFRAAAGAQLAEWSRRAQVEILQLEGVTDPSAVAYQAVEKAIAQQFDFVLIDTAGRLHTQKNLMEELRKIQRTITKRLGREADEALIVLDANSGQNALIQAKEFHSAVPVTGVVLTKMDGTAKGGVAIGVARELRVPIRFVGVGEKAEDLRAFDVDEFIDQILPASSSP